VYSSDSTGKSSDVKQYDLPSSHDTMYGVTNLQAP